MSRRITLERERITPTQAREYLQANESNRRVKERKVLMIARSIERDEFFETGDPIKLGTNGNGGVILRDGQHRLLGIVRANKPAVMWVARNVPKHVQEVIDTGTARNLSDTLQLRGYHNVTVLGAVIRHIWHYRNGGHVLPVYRKATFPSNLELANALEEEPELQERAKWAVWFNRQDRAVGLPPGLVGALVHLFAEASTDLDATTFFEQLLAPEKDTPPALLRRRLQQESAHHKIPKAHKVALTIKAWNYWIMGERPTRLTWRAGGAKREPFPDIEGPDA